MSPTDQAGKRAKQVAPGAKVKLTVGTATPGTPIIIPPQFTLRIYTQNYNLVFQVTDRWGNNWGAGAQFAQLLSGLPYWNGSTEQTANGSLFPPWVDFDGRTFAQVSVNSSVVYAFLLTDPTKSAPGLEDETTD